MKRRQECGWKALVGVAVICGALCGVAAAGEAASQAVAGAGGQDGAVAAALQAIEQKLKPIEDCSCVIRRTMFKPNGTPAILESGELCFKRPNLFFSKITTQQTPIGGLNGSVTYSIIDGKTLWMHTQNAPGSGQELANQGQTLAAKAKGKGAKNVRPMSPEAIKEHEAPKASSLDLGRLKQAGLDMTLMFCPDVAHPFGACDRASLAIERQDGEEWVFTARPSAEAMKLAAQAYSLRLTLGKQDGLLRKAEFLKENKIDRSDVISQVKINSGLKNELFMYVPPPGVVVKDGTADLLQGLAQEKAQPQ
ncbi:MAG: hypothetical protein NTW86_23255 [Candidatus Sumerlaeota bacterium]|nr:hypothetical protein [Candidatus Sumerlaeota bacterium]